jgi:predicted HicB family RNase H-like nuclease
VIIIIKIVFVNIYVLNLILKINAMNNTISYKGFIGSVNYDFKKDLIYGKIEHIQDVVKYKTEFAADVKKVFIKAVNKYIRDCKQSNKRIVKTYNGRFKLYIPTTLHQSAFSYAIAKGISLNQLVQKAIEREIENIS